MKRVLPEIRRSVSVGLLTVCATMSLFFAVGVFTEPTVEGRITRLIWGIAISFGLWMTLIAAAIDHSLHEIQDHLEEVVAPPEFGIPILQPHRTTAEEWTQPTKGEGDQLVEGSQLDSEGEWVPIVLLVRSNGEVHGYSGPIDGAGLNFSLTGGGPEMPPDPA